MENPNGVNITSVAGESASATVAQIPNKTVDGRTELRRNARAAGNRAGGAVLLSQGLAEIFSVVLTAVSAVLMFSSGNSNILSDPKLNLIINALYSPFIMFIPFLIASKFSKKPLRSMMSYSKPKKGLAIPFLFFGLGVAMIGNIVSNALGSIMTIIGIPPVYNDIDLPSGIGGFILSAFTVAVLPALFEEFAYRGVTMGLITEKTSKSTAVFISAFLFGMMHGNFVQIPFAFITGLGLAIAYVQTGSMWVPMAIHFLNNFMSVILDYATKDVSDGTMSVISAIYFIVACSAALVSALILSRRSPDFLKVEEDPSITDVKSTLTSAMSSPCMIIVIIVLALKAISYQVLGVLA